jgi:hypothetical protein
VWYVSGEIQDLYYSEEMLGEAKIGYDSEFFFQPVCVISARGQGSLESGYEIFKLCYFGVHDCAFEMP